MGDKNVVLEGYMKKLKTMKKKYFVLYGDTKDMFAHLRYYDSEKKYKQSLTKRDTSSSKRCIILRECFNINRRMDTKHQHVLALYTKEEGFCIIFDDEEELKRWFDILLRLQKGISLNENEPTPRPLFEHIWEVNVEKKGLGATKGLHGSYRLCISEKNLSFVKIGFTSSVNRESNVDPVDVSLGSIRRYGATQCYFYLEIGRVSKTGAGELWMETADPLTAQNIYDTILRYVKQGKITEETSTVYHRDRSLSVNETSKPNSLHYNHTVDVNCELKSNIESTQRQRCDSMPSSNNPSSNKARTLNRPISVYSRSPTTSSPLSPNSQTISNKSDDDFSINIDEVDNADDLLKNVKSISSSHLKMTILEEKYEDISLSETKQSKTQENVLEDIAQKEGYLIMLPSNDSVKRTETRSRTSSFAEEITNSFGYNPRYHLPDCLSSSASSVTSGTPSTDTRFSAFHLEKTFSHFSDDNDSLNKPIRTYSVGSKPENAKTKAFDSFYYEGQKSSTRSRAFSVGSKIKNRLNENTFKLDLKEKTGKNVQGDKSTSVPVLAKNSKFLTSDHVEVVFSNPTNQQIKFLPSGLTTSEYIEMLPTNYIISELPQVINSDYVDMGVNFSKSERCSSKPIEIKKKKNDNFDDYNMLSSCLQNDDVPGNECQNTIFALSLENKFTLDTDLSHRSNGSKKSSDGTESQQTNSSIKENNAKHDDGDYATLLSNAEVENKNCDEKNICIQNYVDLYFPEKSNIKYANSKKEENVPKSAYAQIVFSDFQPNK